MHQPFTHFALCGAILFAASLAAAQEVTESGKSLEIQVETLLSGLNNPCGVAVRPGTDGETTEIFISDSGALRIIKVVANAPNASTDVVTGFPKGAYGAEPVYDIGPLGLTFLDASTLVVGGGGLEAGADLIRVYKLPEKAEGEAAVAPLTADQMAQSIGPIAAGEASTTGEGDYFTVTTDADKTTLYASSKGDAEKGWVLKAAINDGKLDALTPFIQTCATTEIATPCGVVVSPKKWLVVSQAGEIGDATDAVIAFYKPDNGEMALKLETGLRDAVSVAYSPANEPGDSKLYALDFAWTAPAEGGLFRLEATSLEDRSAGCFSNKLVSLDKPVAMAFAPDGALYVVTIGTAAEGSEEKPGKLLKISGRFSEPAAE